MDVAGHQAHAVREDGTVAQHPVERDCIPHIVGQADEGVVAHAAVGNLDRRVSLRAAIVLVVDPPTACRGHHAVDLPRQVDDRIPGCSIEGQAGRELVRPNVPSAALRADDPVLIAAARCGDLRRRVDTGRFVLQVKVICCDGYKQRVFVDRVCSRAG